MYIGIVAYPDSFVGHWREDCRDGIPEMSTNGRWKEVCRSGTKFVG